MGTGPTHYVAAVTDPKHEDMVEWNGHFNPTAFSAAERTASVVRRTGVTLTQLRTVAVLIMESERNLIAKFRGLRCLHRVDQNSRG